MPNFTAPYGPNEDQEQVVDPIVNILDSETALQKETRATLQSSIKDLFSGRVAPLNQVHHDLPVSIRLLGHLSSATDYS
jgi:hypothetical protein